MIGLPNSKAMIKMRRNESEKKRKKSEFLCVVRTQIMRPRLLELAHCRTSPLRVKVAEQKRGEDCPRPFLLHESVVYWMAANISLTCGVFNFLSAFASI